MKDKRIGTILGLIIFVLFSYFSKLNVFLDIDETIFKFVQQFKHTYLTIFLYIITSIGSIIGTLFILVLLAIIFYRLKINYYFKYILVNVFSSTFLMIIIKNIVKRVRPVWKWIRQDGFSYPSGHMIAAVTLYGTLILVIRKVYKGKYDKAIEAILTIIILLIGLSRIYFGVHYFTDVVGSIILGITVLNISNYYIQKENSNDKNKIKQ